MPKDAKIERERVVGYVKPQQFERLQQIKDDEGLRSMSHLVDRALIEFVERRKKT
jgi:hypothetical protein